MEALYTACFLLSLLICPQLRNSHDLLQTGCVAFLVPFFSLEQQTLRHSNSFTTVGIFNGKLFKFLGKHYLRA